MGFSRDQKNDDNSNLKKREKLRKIGKTKLGLIEHSFLPTISWPNLGDFRVLF